MDLSGHAPRVVTRGGVVFRLGASRFFLSAEVAERVAARPSIARIPGAPSGLLGVGLSEGAILPIIEIGESPGVMIVCVHRGEPLGLVGASDVMTGVFAAVDATAVRVDGEVVDGFDLDEVYRRVHVVSWAAGWR
jgi:hypothetical protein